MKRILIWANTYYQLLMAIQMKISMFQKDYVHLMLSNHSNNAKTVYTSLRDVKVFEGISYVETKGVIQGRTKTSRFKELYDLTLGKTNFYSYYLNDIRDLKFDELISFNLEIDTYAVYSLLSSYNNELEYSSYEEGILSYENFYYDSLKFKVIRAIRRIVGKTNLTDRYTKFYCTHPELYSGKLETVRIPDIKGTDERIRNIVSQIFDVKNTVDYRKYKYIYFESIYETEHRSIGELDVLKQLVERVGSEQILVKKHPRSTIDEYVKMGLDVDINSAAPFEAVQLNNDMSDCIFVTAASGSVLSINSTLDKPSEVRLFYPMTDFNQYPDIGQYISHVNSVITELKKKGSLANVKIVSSINDITN